jgi:3-hydroxyethyl bacteriochlorophyllide a dehydrogenase
MQTAAVILKEPGALELASASLRPLGSSDLLIDVEWSSISSGTERLLWSGRMPDFPGMGYPLIPGYESVGRVAAAGEEAGVLVGRRVFAPGSTAFPDVRCLFGGAARRLVVDARRAIPVDDNLGEKATLLALAATAHHIAPVGSPPPELIVGHGALGRLVARLAVLGGGSPVVWEQQASRRKGAIGYRVVEAAEDERRDYARICDVSGSSAILEQLMQRLAHGGEIVLAGFYDAPLSFAFAPAFMREARLRVAAQWRPEDLRAAAGLVADGRLSLDDILTHCADASAPGGAYRQAFQDSDCLKMVLDWRSFT